MQTNRPMRIVRHIIIIIVAVVMLYPLLWMLGSSFNQNSQIFKDTSLIPNAPTLINYVQGWAGLSNVTFGRFFLNSFFIVAMCIIGNVLSCSMAAYAFARLNFAFRGTLFGMMFLTLMLPFHVTLIPQYILFDHLGWINTYWPLILPKFLGVEGFFIFLMVQFMRNIPRELDEAARVDGCGPIKMYWYLMLPLALPALITTTIFTFIWTWNDYFSQLIYISNSNLYTVALALRQFVDATGQTSWGGLFAMSTLSLVPLFLVFIFFQKYLVEGITVGGVKG
ncbi:carbohydrate ABC transporter permease [Alicyclobacillus fastidiosus]|uniref:Carbohydrate ABC transporter permease n=1 Tax=Alicyclobacillus fastidiosus TaxID=392011 RepID=A0ABV5A943_9BACL|nr:carbohydrate ABC transporter permease [Alicyclobacillus fastidiosus]WEH10749.1 carbohydrate ABC transporter permease [Alicyclobacillus fastidiosus]